MEELKKWLDGIITQDEEAVKGPHLTEYNEAYKDGHLSALKAVRTKLEQI